MKQKKDIYDDFKLKRPFGIHRVTHIGPTTGFVSEINYTRDYTLRHNYFAKSVAHVFRRFLNQFP